MTKLQELKAAMEAADAEVSRLCREEYARAEAAKGQIAKAREVAFAAAAAWAEEARLLIRKP